MKIFRIYFQINYVKYNLIKKSLFQITKMFAYLSILIIVNIGCDKEGSKSDLAITTFDVIDITYSSAQCGGRITDDGGSEIISRGVCWSTNQNPTISENKTVDGSGMGMFVSRIQGLNSGSKYYIRSYATNSSGTTYGNQVTFTTSTIPSISGTWSIDTVGTAIGITYKSSFVEGSSAATQFVKNNKDKIRRILFNPQKITFNSSGVATFYYSTIGNISGTFVQDKFSIVLKNPNFPNGLNGAWDNTYLEVLYDKPFLMNVLYSILKDNDPAASLFVNVIDSFQAVGVYKKSVTP